MKMIGMPVRSPAMSLCNSRPLRSGSETSSIRQHGAKARGWARNSSADAKTSGCQPAKLISNSSDSRTEMSSSTTKTIGLSCDSGDNLAVFISTPQCALASAAHLSSFVKSCVERLKQSRLAEWLEKTLHGAAFEQARTHRLIRVSGDEDYRNLLLATRQFPLEVGAGHARHGDVEDQTSGLADEI